MMPEKIWVDADACRLLLAWQVLLLPRRRNPVTDFATLHLGRSRLVASSPGDSTSTFIGARPPWMADVWLCNGLILVREVRNSLQ